MKKGFYLLIVLTIFSFSSCHKDELQNTTSIQEDDSENILFSSQRNTEMKKFAFAFAKSLKESSQLRILIKNEVLKMFDKDYEVLVYEIKDKLLENGKTFESLIKENSESDFQLNNLLQIEPTLTILVPKLPLDSFSAETWDASNEIPAVAIRTNVSNKTPMITPEGELGIIPSDAVPGFPVLVLKNNERVVVNRDFPNFENLKTSTIFKKDEFVFKFWDSAFDNTNNTISNSAITDRFTMYLDPTLVEAYDIYQQQYPNLNGWQRDYIYYGIQPSNPNGPFSYDFKEHMRSFRMSGTGINAYNKIADQADDPHIVGFHRIGTSHWTGGFFEFRVSTLINGTNGVGNELVNGFTVAPSDLFNLQYDIITTGWWFWKKRWYRLRSVSNKTIAVNLPIINWNLDDYSTSIKISVEEVDLTTTTVVSDSRTMKFATNFEFSPSLGEKVKLGLKFGASNEVTETHTVQKTFTQGNDDLGSTIVNFADKVILQKHNWYFGRYYVTREYYTNYCQFSIEPKRVQ